MSDTKALSVVHESRRLRAHFFSDMDAINRVATETRTFLARQGLSHEAAGRRMNVSRATFGRVVRKARKTVADALVHGMAIRIEGGDYLRTEPDGAVTFCGTCRKEWHTGLEIGSAGECPLCKKKEAKPRGNNVLGDMNEGV